MRIPYVFLAVFIAAIACTSSKDCSLIVTLGTPTSFEKMTPGIPIIEIIHDEEVLVPANILSAEGKKCPYTAGASVYFLVDDVEKRFGSKNIFGKRFRVELKESEPEIWDYSIKPL